MRRAAIILALAFSQEAVAQTPTDEPTAALIKPSHPNCYITRIDGRRPGFFSGKTLTLKPGLHVIKLRTAVYQFTGGGIGQIDYTLEPNKTYRLECEIEFPNHLSYRWRAWLVDASTNEIIANAVIGE